MTEQDEVTVKMLKNLIANIEAGNITTVNRDGFIDGNGVRLILDMSGTPDKAL